MVGWAKHIALISVSPLSADITIPDKHQLNNSFSIGLHDRQRMARQSVISVPGIPGGGAWSASSGQRSTVSRATVSLRHGPATCRSVPACLATHCQRPSPRPTAGRRSTLIRNYLIKTAGYERATYGDVSGGTTSYFLTGRKVDGNRMESSWVSGCR